MLRKKILKIKNIIIEKNFINIGTVSKIVKTFLEIVIENSFVSSVDFYFKRLYHLQMSFVLFCFERFEMSLIDINGVHFVSGSLKVLE